jgi:hypothetical protein
MRSVGTSRLSVEGSSTRPVGTSHPSVGEAPTPPAGTWRPSAGATTTPPAAWMPRSVAGPPTPPAAAPPRSVGEGIARRQASGTGPRGRSSPRTQRASARRGPLCSALTPCAAGPLTPAHTLATPPPSEGQLLDVFHAPRRGRVLASKSVTKPLSLTLTMPVGLLLTPPAACRPGRRECKKKLTMSVDTE